MPILNRASSAAYTALIYITLGSLILVWSGIWYWRLAQGTPAEDTQWTFCYGFLLTGMVLLAIGLLIGRIGRAARHAELPPKEVTPAVTQVEQTAAARAPVVAPINAAQSPVNGPVPPASPVVAVPPVPPRTGEDRR